MDEKTARLAIETLMRIVGEVHGVEIETIWRDKNEEEKNRC